MLKLQMIPISGGSIHLYHKGQENIYASLSKQDYARNIPRNNSEMDYYTPAVRTQIEQINRYNAEAMGDNSWLNQEHIGQFMGHTFTYRNADIVLPGLCILGIGLAVYFL